jgi:phosphotransferase system  glucose/maltose/N-acetylglucosamine-specific IIC component
LLAPVVLLGRDLEVPGVVVVWVSVPVVHVMVCKGGLAVLTDHQGSSTVSGGSLSDLRWTTVVLLVFTLVIALSWHYFFLSFFLIFKAELATARDEDSL